MNLRETMIELCENALNALIETGEFTDGEVAEVCVFMNRIHSFSHEEEEEEE